MDLVNGSFSIIVVEINREFAELPRVAFRSWRLIGSSQGVAA